MRCERLKSEAANRKHNSFIYNDMLVNRPNLISGIINRVYSADNGLYQKRMKKNYSKYTSKSTIQNNTRCVIKKNKSIVKQKIPRYISWYFPTTI